MRPSGPACCFRPWKLLNRSIVTLRSKLPSRGIVYLVGAGPGDAGLFTLRGKEVLGRAEVVIYDGLVNLALLRLAPPTAEIIFGGKHDRTRCVTQIGRASCRGRVEIS